MKNRNIVLCGDVHNNWTYFFYQIDTKKIDHTDIFVLGDCCIGGQNLNNEMKKLNYLNDELKKDDNNLYLLRGNHDDPDFFDKDFIQANNLKFSNLFLLSDNDLIIKDDIQFIIFGGAVSVDRHMRIKQNLNFYFNEGFFYDKYKLDNLIQKIDKNKKIIILAHDVPHRDIYVNPYGLKERFDTTDEVILQVIKHTDILKDTFNYLIHNGLTIQDWYAEIGRAHV